MACKAEVCMFDTLWCSYEQAYIGELMVIERDARRFIYELVSSLSNDSAFIKAVGLLNAAANVQGQGRSEFETSLLEKINSVSSKSDKVKNLLR